MILLGYNVRIPLFDHASRTRTMKVVDLIRLKSSFDKIPLFPSKSSELTVVEPTTITTSKQFLKADFDWPQQKVEKFLSC